jgi:hypothetical protein
MQAFRQRQRGARHRSQYTTDVHQRDAFTVTLHHRERYCDVAVSQLGWPSTMSSFRGLTIAGTNSSLRFEVSPVEPVKRSHEGMPRRVAVTKKRKSSCRVSPN